MMQIPNYRFNQLLAVLRCGLDFMEQLSMLQKLASASGGWAPSR